MNRNRKLFRKRIQLMLAFILLVGIFTFTNYGKYAGAQNSFLDNHSFEEDLESWETNGSEAIETPEDDWLPENGGSKRLNYWADDAYVADTYQTVTNIDNGSYTISVWVANSGEFNEAYVYAKDTGAEEERLDIPSTDGGWSQIEMPVEIENGQATIGFYADAEADAWLGIDLVELVKNVEEPPQERGDFINGVDISTLSKVEDYGGKFYDQGVEKDVLDILTGSGSNYARLKVWEDPVDVYENGMAYNDLQDTIEKAVRIKEADMKFLLNFHYSGFWADPGRQDKPGSWENLSFEELVQAVYDHTADTIEALIDAGAAPDMVQVGNEIRPGMLFPDGRISNNDFSNLAELLNSGIQAVRDTLGDEVDIMLHLDQGGDNDAYRWWFDGVTAEGVEDFQIIGASYYPYWHGTLDDLEHNLNDISERYDKDVVVVETAYAFTLDDKDGHSNIFSAAEEEIAGYPATVEGQARFLYDVMEVVRNVPNNRGLGIFYWEPAWLGVDGAGWRAGEGNAWENQAMFDFEGNALESLKVFTPGHVPPIPEPREQDEEEEDPTLKELTLHSLNKSATASSSEGHGGGKNNAPENAVDDDPYTSWGTDEGEGAWWQVDLEEEVSIERLLLHFWDGVRKFKVELSNDGEEFTTLDTFEVESPNMDLTLPEGTSARHVRVTITEATSNWVGFMYFKAYGSDELPDLDNDEDEDENGEKPPGKDEDQDPVVKTVKKGEQVAVNANEVIKIEGSESTITLPDTLPEGTTLLIKDVDQSKLDKAKLANLIVAGDVFEFIFKYPNGEEQYSGIFVLSLAYDLENFDASDIQIYYFDEEADTWIAKGGTVENDLITIEANHFSAYGVFAEIEEEEGIDEENDPPVDGNNDETSGLDEDNDEAGGNGKSEADKQAGGQLPDTATETFNMLMTGILLLAAGITVLFIKRRKKVIE